MLILPQQNWGETYQIIRQSQIFKLIMNKRIGDFEIKKTLGQGTFGMVKEGIHVPTGQRVAIKILQKRRIIEKDDLKRIFREISILKKIHHPNIVQLYELFETEKNVYLITQYIKGGQLYSQIVEKGKLEQSTAKKYLFKIIQAVEYLHKKNIAHRDLKPQNIMIDAEENIKLIDFGLSTEFESNDLLISACGSPCYAAPEMVKGEKYNPIMTDMWAIGIILYAMTSGYLPFQDQNRKKMYQKIVKGCFQIPSHFTQSLRNLVKGLIKVDPKQRLTIEQIKSHKWLFGITSTPKKIQSNMLHQNVITMIQKLLSQSRQRIQEEIQNQQHSAIYTYYYLLKKKMTKQWSQFDLFSRKRIQSEIHRKQSTQLSFEPHTGPIHFSYLFRGKYNQVKIEILSKYQGLEPKFKTPSILTFLKHPQHPLKLKTLGNNSDCFYLDVPFYYPITL